MNFNIKLFGAYMNKGLKSYEIAERAGIEKTRFCRILSGKLAVRPNEKKRLSEILKVAQKDLF